MDKILGAATSLSLLLNLNAFASTPQPSPSPDPVETLQITQPIQTETKFGTKVETKTETISKKTIYKDDPETEAGIETVLEEGEDGKKIITTEITFYEGEEYDRKVVKTEVIDPKDKIISRGTKIVWRTLDTPEGPIQYWKKMRVYTTHYDSHCPGCDDTTAIGLKAGHGVVAVDPQVIKMRTQMYIPGYGKAIAGDTGGAIKGNMIDLGFDDARTADWTAHYIDIYLL